MGDLGLEDSEPPPEDEGRWDPAPTGKRDAGETPADEAGTDGEAGAVATRKRVFVTSEAFSPNFGSVEAAHAKCKAAAAKANLGGDWVAWLSGGTTRAADLLTFDGRYELTNGTVVAQRKTVLLEGPLAAPIDVMEDGKKVPKDVGVWTGTHKAGQPGENCANWTDKTVSSVGTAGSVEQTDARWTDMGGEPLADPRGWHCSWTGRLYCFER
jgi:hypothetical protein